MKKQYSCINTKQQKTEEDPFLAKAYFLKNSQAISPIPDKYV
jgi:hypothetical protein